MVGAAEDGGGGCCRRVSRGDKKDRTTPRRQLMAVSVLQFRGGGGSARSSVHRCLHLKHNPAQVGLKLKQVSQRYSSGHARSDLTDYTALLWISWNLQYNLF